MSIALSLIALGMGYLVYASSMKEKEGIKLLGQIVGIAIMVMALCTTICASMKCMKGGCPLMSKSKMMCPIGSSSASPEMPAAN